MTLILSGIESLHQTRHETFGRPVQAAGCPERPDLDFLRWVWHYDRDTLPRVEEAVARHAWSAVIHRLRSSAEVREFLARAATPSVEQ